MEWEEEEGAYTNTNHALNGQLHAEACIIVTMDIFLCVVK